MHILIIHQKKTIFAAFKISNYYMFKITMGRTPMMKKTIVSISFLLISIFNICAQRTDIYEKECFYGISFQKSENRNWGYGELVITSVEPYSPADSLGIKVNDIIMEINGQATFLRDNVTIAKWLFDNPDPVVKFTIRNLDTYFKEYTLHRKCMTVNSVNESYLSNLFSFYSLENSRELNFKLPLTVTPTPDVDYTDYHTFAFYNEGQKVTPLDIKIQTILEKNLNKMGLKRDEKDPDFWISIYYEHTPNVDFRSIYVPSSLAFSQRYCTDTKKMENYPIYDYTMADVEMSAQFVVNLGFTFFEKKYIDKEKFTQIWECNIKDFLSDNLTLAEYADVHVPLMLMQYPYSTPKKDCEYYVAFNKYNYTGLYFDADTVQYVNDVDADSPAFKAGLRPGYRIDKVGNKKFEYTLGQLSQGYKKFILDTDSFREDGYVFKGIEGYECRYWNPVYYPEIAKKFKESKYATAFSYLFEFEKYVNPSYSGAISIEGWDGIQKRIFMVYPKIRESTIIKAL